jgi:drug/metabolite transporter (DMT)-like permease
VLLRLRSAIAPESFVAVTFWIGVAVTGPLAAWEWSDGQEIRWSIGVAGAFAYVCVLPSIVSYFIYNWATAQVGAASAGQAITLMPILGALLSALLLGEALHTYHWLGMALILGGILLAALAYGRKLPAGAG